MQQDHTRRLGTERLRPARSSRLTAAGIAVVSPILAYVLPPVVSPLFSGPDGVRWVAPFILWMGAVGALYLLFVPWTRRHFGGKEAVWLTGAVCALGGILVFVAAQRLSSGMRELEAFHEAGCLRVATGVGLYTDGVDAPQGTYYTPGLYLLGGLIAWLVPGLVGYSRIVSLTATSATVWLVYSIAQKRLHSRLSGLWAAALFLATYPVMGRMYDWGLIDPLLMCVLASCAYFLVDDTARGDLAALWLAGLACLVKQPAAIPFAVVLGTVVASKRPAWVYSPLLFWAIVAAAMILGTQGRAWTYLAASPLSHSLRPLPSKESMFRLFVVQMPLWVLAVVSWRRRSNLRFEIFAGSVFLACLLGAWKVGGWINTVFPFEPLLCVAAAGFGGRWRLLGIAQMALGFYNPFATLYPWATVRVPDRLAMALARQVAGDVWFPAQPYLSVLSRKPMWEDFAVLETLGDGGMPPPARLVSALERKRFDLVIIREGGDFWLMGMHPIIEGLLQRNYVVRRQGHLLVYEPK
jgi:hypothetical protein